MSMTAVPISIFLVRAPAAARSGNGEPSWRAKWWTRKYAPSRPSSSAAAASSIDCSSAFDAVRTSEYGAGVQCPKERKPIFFTQPTSERRPHQPAKSCHWVSSSRCLVDHGSMILLCGYPGADVRWTVAKHNATTGFVVAQVRSRIHGDADRGDLDCAEKNEMSSHLLRGALSSRCLKATRSECSDAILV